MEETSPDSQTSCQGRVRSLSGNCQDFGDILLWSYGGFHQETGKWVMTKGIVSSKFQTCHFAFSLFAMMASLIMTATSAWAQESVIAIGKVNAIGSLANSASPIGATIGCSRTTTGGYLVTVTSAGAFAGASESDFMVETSMEDIYANDQNSAAAIQSVTADVVTVRVRTFDLEAMTPPDLAVAADDEFFFVIRRIDHLTSGQPLESRHLVAVGTVRSSGLLDTGFGVDGVQILTGRGTAGEYFIQLSKAGGFATDANAQYVLLLSPRGVSVPDISIRGSIYNAISDENALFYIRSEDVQAATAADDPVAADTSFSFAVFNASTQDTNGEGSSNLLKAVASVDGDSGNLLAGSTAYPGATISSVRTSPGRYDVFIDSPGSFAGVDDASLAAFVTLNNSNTIDDLAKTRVAVVDANRIRIDVSVDDVQHNNDEDGIPADGSFFVSVYDAAPVLRHDLRVGKQSTGSDARGAGIFNGSGAGQSLKLTLPGKAKRSAYFHASNRGSSVDSLRLKSGKIPSTVKVNFFLTSGGGGNVTATVRSGGTVATGLLPGDSVSVQASIRYRKLSKRPKAKVGLSSLSGYQPANVDTNLVLLKAK
jgi:hypothetical protein